MEAELWGHTMKGADHIGYTNRFQELSQLVPHIVTPEEKAIDRYINGLPSSMRSMILTVDLGTLQDTINLASTLTDELVKTGILVKDSGKQKEREFKKTSYQPNKKPKTTNYAAVTPAVPVQAVAPSNQAPARAGYSGPHPLCPTYNYHHPPSSQCRKCTNCGRFGHLAPQCRTAPAVVNQAMVANPAPTNNNNARACFQCGGLDHFKNNCPQLAPNNNQATRGRAFTIGASDARQDPNVITGTFLLNNHFASILFDTGAERSFISLDFKPLVKWKPTKLDFPYIVKLANGKTIQANTIIRDSTLTFDDHSLNIDLIPFKLGSFDLVVGMDWLSRNQAKVVYAEKLIRIPLPSGETLIIQGEKPDRNLKVISCMKARKLLRKQCYAFLAHVVNKKSEVKKIQDNSIVKDYPEVFPDDLLGLPPSRQVEFRIDLYPV
ncbi:uncharacterized protein LOC143556298 [Bidens hawaiensis]|uniref:uncharacterized protein LOC143556298 n=1 Tax=Bidens hawaiensis TaxID=980011 RepID=UPI004049077E